MHDGSEATLESVVELYNKGGVPNRHLDGGIRPLNLTEQEKKDLVDFMKSLTSPEVEKIGAPSPSK
jgi:cytochrome c peroxidase